MKKKILIIDDERNIAETLADILDLKGYDVKTAPEGREGLSLADRFGPDLILCDIMMPEMDGYEVLEAVRKNYKLMQTPFIFLSAKDSHQDFREGMTLGADDYLSKPVDADVLYKTIERRIEKHRMLLEAVHFEEAHRMSMEMHDTLQQTLLGLRMKLSHFREKHSELATITEIDESLDYIKLAFSQFRMILEYGTLYQNEGFIQCLEQMIKRISRYVDFDVSLQNELQREIPKTEARILFRVLMEIFNNAIKHSNARKLFIHVTGTGSEVSLVILDDGCGFDINKTYKGNGLLNIRERVKELGGDVHIQSEPGAGTSIEVLFKIRG